MRILFTGGGTIGSVSPLLAIKDTMETQNIPVEGLWVGTESGLEKDIINKQGMDYVSIKAGKLRRYFSWRNFIDPFLLMFGVAQSISIIRKFKPDVVLSAGGFVSVPVVWAAWLLKKKSIVHQQDLKPGLANLLMAKCASLITVAFEKNLADFPNKKVRFVGNPFRHDLTAGNRERAIERFGLESDLPTLFIMGGSLGAEFLNELVMNSLTRLIDFCQVLHLTGKGNQIEWQDKLDFAEKANRYHQYEYMYDELADAYAVSDLVVCRAGLSTLTELTHLEKPAIVISIPDHQQEENAKYFVSKNAILTLDQNKTNADDFVLLVQELFENEHSLKRLSNNIKDMMPMAVNENYVKLIQELVNN